MSEKVLIIDIGNSATELAVFENEKMVEFLGFFKLPKQKDELFSSLENGNKKYSLHRGMIFSVVPEKVSKVVNLVKKVCGFNIPVFDWNNYILKNKSEKITEPIGADLLADLKAAEKYYAGSVLIADCGTITKLLLTDKDSKFVGLSIIPGIETMLKTFNACTALLPDSEELNKVKDEFGHNTIESMNHGVYWSTVSYIKEQSKIIDMKKGKLIITGGNLRYIKNEFPNAVVDQYFTLKGMNILYEEVAKWSTMNF